MGNPGGSSLTDDYVYMHIGRLWARLLALEVENRELMRRLVATEAVREESDRVEHRA